MFSRASLCPSCHQFLGKLAATCEISSETFNQLNDSVCDSQELDAISRKCSGCDEVFSMVKPQKSETNCNNFDLERLTTIVEGENSDSTHLECGAVGKEKMPSHVSHIESNEKMNSELNNSLKPCETVDYEGNENTADSIDVSLISNDPVVRHKRPLSDEELEFSNSEKSQRLIKSPLIDRVPSRDQENDDGTSQTTAPSRARKRSMKPKQKYVDCAFPIFSCDTHQKVTPTEIKEKIDKHFIIDKSKSLPYICQIDHDCYKSYINECNVEHHLFKHFFYVPCPNCGQYARSHYAMKRHFSKCKEKFKFGQSSVECNNKRPVTESPESNPANENGTKKRKVSQPISNNNTDDSAEVSHLQKQNTNEQTQNFQFDMESSLSCENRLSNIRSGNEAETISTNLQANLSNESNETIKPQPQPIAKAPILYRPIKYDYLTNCSKNIRNKKVIKLETWTHPIYAVETHQKVEADEIKAKIQSSYRIDEKKAYPFICKIVHECQRSFISSWHIENHVFSYFFYIPCPSCGRIFNYLFSIDNHIKMCGDKPYRIVGKKAYRCPFCDYIGKPGKRVDVFNHLNGFNKNRKFTPPSCPRRKMFKPADPMTGTFEQLEPILIEPEKVMTTPLIDQGSTILMQQK